METLLNALALGELLGVSVIHVEKLRKSGALPYVKLGKSRLIRFRIEDVKAYLDTLQESQRKK